MTDGSCAPAGRLSLQRVAAPTPKPRLTLEVVRDFGLAKPGQPAEVKAWKRDNEQHLERGIRDLEAVARGSGPRFLGALWATVLHHDRTLDLGLISARVVTTVGVGFIVDAWQNLVELETMRYHGMGTGTAAEASSDTALGAELTTAYLTDNTRPTGTLTEGASGNIFETVATVTVDAATAATEHGLFSNATRGSGVLFDRSVFSVVNLAVNEAIQFTYDATLPAGS